MKNILFIMTDQMRHDALGVNSKWMKTPNLDQLAKDGVVFDECITNSPLCVPARMSLATGESPNKLGIDNNVDIDLKPTGDLWTNQIKELGYQTALFGKTHLHRHTGDLRDRQHILHDCGFDVVNEIAGPRACLKVESNMTDLWKKHGLLDAYKRDISQRLKDNPLSTEPSVLPIELYADCYVGDQAEKYLQTVETSQPWFVWVSFGGPHEPWDTPEPFASMYENVDIPKPLQAKGNKDYDVPPESVHGKRFRSNPAIDGDPILQIRRNYAGNVSLIDDQLGKIMATLRKRGMYDNTLIVFTSDHGEMNGDYGLVYKGVFFDQAVRVPLIVSNAVPRQERARDPVVRRNGSLVQLCDIGPTIVELAGGEPRSDQYAESFAKSVLYDGGEHRKVAFSELAGETMVYSKKWKAVFNKDSVLYLFFRYRRGRIFESRNSINSAWNKVYLAAIRRLYERYRSR